MRDHRNHMLMIELAIVLVFFAVTQAITLQVFAKAQQMNRDAATVNRALTDAEEAAETLSVSQDPESALALLGFSQTADGWQTDSGKGYRLTATVDRLMQPAGVLVSITLRAYQGDAELFTLPTRLYQKGVSP